MMASRMGRALARASRRFKDVPVVLNGALAQEREALVAAAMQEPTRLGGKGAAEAALRAWDDEHRDEVLMVRVRSCLGDEWKQLRVANPLPKDTSQHEKFDAVFGFDVVGATIDACEKFALVVDGDDTVQPTAEEWAEFWRHINRGDMTALTEAVVELNGTTTSKAFGDLVKA